MEGRIVTQLNLRNFGRANELGLFFRQRHLGNFVVRIHCIEVRILSCCVRCRHGPRLSVGRLVAAFASGSFSNHRIAVVMVKDFLSFFIAFEIIQFFALVWIPAKEITVGKMN